MFISSRSCSETQSWKNAAEEKRLGVRGGRDYVRVLLVSERPCRHRGPRHRSIWLGTSGPVIALEVAEAMLWTMYPDRGFS